MISACIGMAACTSGPSDHQIMGDFLSSPGWEGQAPEITGVTRGDGWDDGAEVRVYFKPRTCATKCEAAFASMSYQQHDAGKWRLLYRSPQGKAFSTD